eukprot:TRINITY_DN3353_c0_g2_i6.p1 TRINITY_DN3353_c0_g2~~TRINITY_DN3353_c0_g2_i6.p1  ORF type:complete len:492 (-),score=43.68 TRINITY_DN3353_c0_g2_i6:126-1601(-)
MTVCVKSCPSWEEGGTPPPIDCKPNSYFKTCETTTDPLDVTKLYLYQSKPTFGVACTGLPVEAAGFLTDALKGFFDQLVIGLIKNLWKVAICIVLCTLIAIMVMIFIRFCADVVVWGQIIVTIAILLTAGAFIISYTVQIPDRGFFSNFFLAVGIILSLVGVGILTYVVFNVKNIKIVIGVFKATGQYVAETPLMVVITCLKMLLNIVFAFIWFTLVLWLATIGPKVADSEHDFVGTITKSASNNTLQGYLIGIGGWIQTAILQSLYLLNCTAVSLWYFRNLNPGLPIMKTALSWTYIYHLGSASFGGTVLLLISVFGFVICRGGEENTRNMVGKFCCCCCTCLDQFVQHLNKKAYVQIALTGKEFCSSAKDAFHLAIRNVILTSTLVSLKGAIISIGRGAIILIPSAFGVIWIFSSTDMDKENPILAVAIVLFVNYCLANGFMTVWSAGTDAMLHCYCVDEELFLRAKHAPENLKGVTQDIKVHAESIKE